MQLSKRAAQSSDLQVNRFQPRDTYIVLACRIFDKMDAIMYYRWACSQYRVKMHPVPQCLLRECARMMLVNQNLELVHRKERDNIWKKEPGDVQTFSLFLEIVGMPLCQVKRVEQSKHRIQARRIGVIKGRGAVTSIRQVSLSSPICLRSGAIYSVCATIKGPVVILARRRVRHCLKTGANGRDLHSLHNQKIDQLFGY